jgi:hypothetical protein
MDDASPHSTTGLAEAHHRADTKHRLQSKEMAARTDRRVEEFGDGHVVVGRDGARLHESGADMSFGEQPIIAPKGERRVK